MELSPRGEERCEWHGGERGNGSERFTREWDYNHRMTLDGHLAFSVNPDAKPRPTNPPGGAAADGQAALLAG